MLVDTHCHVYSEYYDDIDGIISDAHKSGVDIVVSAGVDRSTNHELIELISRYSEMYACIGIHPENVLCYSVNDINEIAKNLHNPKIVAIGEIGLDYHYDNYDKDKQIELFEKQLEIAEKYNMPVVVHSRDATQDTLNILKKYKVTGVIHSFSGSKEVALEYIKMGFKLGLNGVVTFKNAHIKEVVKEIGLQHFVLETDSPYLTPEPMRGKTNYPAYIIHIVEFLSDYLCISANEIESITTKNAIELFSKIRM